jgi:hypothetical protein
MYHLLWSKDELSCGVKGVAIPDTIVYRHRQPAAWFFTSKFGDLKKKNRANVSNAKVEVRPLFHFGVMVVRGLGCFVSMWFCGNIPLPCPIRDCVCVEQESFIVTKLSGCDILAVYVWSDDGTR